jgi:hypothetical protein
MARSINTTFAVSRVTKPLTKFYWALSKLPSTWVDIDTIGPLCDNPSATDDPYAELQHIVLRSYGLMQRPPEDRQMDGQPRPWGEQAIGPDGQTQRPEANLGGRDPEGPVPPQDAPPPHIRDIVNLRDFPDLPALP